MSRRVFDSVVMESLKTPEDKEIVRKLMDDIGEGEEVDDYKTPIKTLGCSKIPISQVGIKEKLKPFMDGFLKSNNDSECVIIDTSGTEHTVSLKSIAIIKSLVMYRLTCNKVIFDAINDTLDYIDAKLTNSKDSVSKKSVVIDQDEDSVVFVSSKNTSKYMISEVNKLLSNAGLNLDEL